MSGLKTRTVHTRFDVTDLFCGAGGSTTGAKSVGDVEVAVAVNHNKLSVETHAENHPETRHWVADILPGKAHPRTFPKTSILIGSPECTKHSGAAGKKVKNRTQLSLWEYSELDPEEERSRVTMFTIPYFAQYHQYEYIIIENVVEIRYWHQWDTWLTDMANLGYDWQICYFNSMFFNPINGLHNYAPQSRDRIYVVFHKKGNPKPNLDFRPLAPCEHCEAEVHAVQSWKNPKRKWGRYKKQYVYCCHRCAKEVTPFYYAAYNAIDWGVPIVKISERTKPLKQKTINRIKAGLKKYGGQPAVVQLGYSHSKANRVSAILDPFPTQTTGQTTGLITSLAYDREGLSLSDPYPAQTAQQRAGLIVPMRGDLGGITMDRPTHAVTTTNAPFMIEMYGTGGAREIIEPAGTQLAGGNHTGLIFTDLHGRSIGREGNREAPAQSTVQNTGIVVSYYGRDSAHSPINAPVNTVSTNPRHGLLAPPLVMGHNNPHGQPVSKPAPTTTTVDRISLSIPGGVDVMDCGFRMFVPKEVKLTMGFHVDYILLGSNRDQVKMAGNAVTPPVMEWLIIKCKEALLENQ